ncbi:MAG: DEAD/DEAH box helicase [Phycisphaerales bacterium]|nr:DEAD/DEAH box helicase [Phycisphaerales bacterium]
MKFTDLGLCEPILRAITSAGYEVPTPIQAKAIPEVLAGRDVLGCAQTGTGKTAAFCLPMAHRLMDHAAAPAHDASHAPRGAAAPQHHGGGHHHRGPKRVIRALILSPTRELTLQIAENLAIYARNSRLKHTVIFGGVGQGQQVRDLQAGVDIVVATPGRLEDLKQQGYVDLRHVEVFVLDEADRMLDMGFIEPIRRIAALVPKKRQTLLFSATMAPEIRKLAHSLLHEPVYVEVAPAASLPTLIDHSVFHVHRGDKPALLSHLLNNTPITRALVFTRTKHGADKVVKRLSHDGIHAEAIHGNKRQNVRQRTLSNFKSGRTMVLVATDIAARGIDVDDVSHVINYELPNEPETYVHRIGRTGRAGAKGKAVSFCDHDERSDLRQIERLLKKPIEVVVTPEIERDPAGEAISKAERPPRHFRDRTHDDRRDNRPQRSPEPRGGHAARGHGSRGEGRPQSAHPHAPAHPRPQPRPAHPHNRTQADAGSRPAAGKAHDRTRPHPHGNSGHTPAPAPRPTTHRKGPPPSDHRSGHGGAGGTGGAGKGRRGQPGSGFRGRPRGDR